MSLVRPHLISYSNNANRPWIVLINGLFVNKNSWDLHLEYLEKYNVLRYDCVGQAEDEVLHRPYSLESHVSNLKELLDELDISQVSLLGISNGGRIALKFAELHSTRVQKVITGDTYDILSNSLKLKLESWLYASQAGGNKLRFKVSTPWIFGETLINEKPELITYFENLSEERSQINSENLIKTALRQEDQIDLSKIQNEILFYVGEEDLLTTVKDHKLMAMKCHNAQFIKVKGGHASLLEYPENLNIIMEKLCLG